MVAERTPQLGDAVTPNTAALVGLTLFAMPLGCSDGPDAPPRLASSSSSGVDGVEARRGGLVAPSCEHGDVRECTRVISVHGDVVTCASGIQYCVDGVWTECGSDTPDEFLPDAGSDRGRSDDAAGHVGSAGAPSVR